MSVNRGTQIREFEETIQTSPTTVRKTAIYEAQRTIGTGQPTLSVTSSGFRTVSPSSGISPKKPSTTEEASIEEKYEITISSFDDSGVKLLSSEPMSSTSITDEGYVSLTHNSSLIVCFHLDLNSMKKCLLHVLLSMNLSMRRTPIKRKWLVVRLICCSMESFCVVVVL